MRGRRTVVGAAGALVLLSLALSPALAATLVLKFTGVTIGTFPSTGLTGSNKQITTTISTYSVTDTRSSPNGWHFTFQAAQFSCTAGTGNCPAGGDSFPTSSLLMGKPTVACGSGCGSGTPTISMTGTVALDAGTAVTVASGSTTSTGTWNFTPSTISCTIGTCSGNLVLTIPGSAYAATYSSTVTVTLTAGP